MEIAVDTTSAGLVLRVQGHRIDAAGAIGFKEAVREAVDQPGAPVILDMSRVGFLDSSGLGAIIAVMKMLGPERPLQLAGVQPNVAKVLRLTQMDRVFTIHRDPPTAARAVG